MSRSSNRGPRGDIALLRKLKADPNFSPSSLLSSGPNFLEKANKLKGFVEQQRGKLGASAAKTEWLLAYQQLQGDQDDAERELAAFLQQLADQPVHEQLREMAEVALATLYDQGEMCRAERLSLRAQVKGISSMHSSIKSYGLSPTTSKEAAALQGEMSATARDLEGALSELGEQTSVLATELRECWPSALLVSSGLGGDASASAAVSASTGGEAMGQLPGYSRSEDVEELKRMLGRYPLASSDIKNRIQQVFFALQEKFLERLETWRVESEQAARDLASGPSTSTYMSSQAAARRGPHAASASSSGRGRAAGAPSRGAGRQGPMGRGPAGRALPAGRVGSGRDQGPSAATAAGGGSPGPPEVAARTCSGHAVQQPAAAAEGGDWALTSVGLAADAAAGPSREAYGDDDVPAAESASTPTGEAGSASHSGLGGGGGSSGSWAFGGCGGWSVEEHMAFLRHRDRLMKEAGTGAKSASREAIMGRIATLLPGGRTAAELMAHDDWATAARLMARKRRDLAEAWDRERRQFLEDSASFLQESETLFLVQAEEAADRLVAELQRVRARDELEELRVERAREEEVAAAERAAREAAEAEARLQAEARERKERAVKKDMVAAYRAELERQQAEQQAAAAEVERLAAQVAEHQAVYNKERVEVRQAEYAARQEEAKARLVALEEEERARQARLDRLRALVAPEVEADPERVLAPTCASAAAVDKSEGAFHPVNGYTTEQVVKDQRFKVMEALAVLGLHETTYGRQAIAAAKPARAPRPDNFTTEQREALMRR